MEFAIRQIITKAVTEVESESRSRTEPLSGNEFLTALFAKLFPSEVEIVMKTEAAPAEPQAVEVPVVAAAPAAPVKEKKKPGPKPKLDENGNPLPKKPRAKKAKTTESAPTSEPESENEAAPAPPATPEKPAEPKPEAEAPAAPVKKPRAKKEKGPVNKDKLTPTETKQLKKLLEEAKVEADKKDFLAYLNGLTAEEYGPKTLEDHIKDFIKTRQGGVAAPAPVEEKELDVVEIDLDGKTYYADKDSRVYREEGGSYVFAGYVGMSAFANEGFVAAYKAAMTE